MDLSTRVHQEPRFTELECLAAAPLPSLMAHTLIGAHDSPIPHQPSLEAGNLRRWYLTLHDSTAPQLGAVPFDITCERQDGDDYVWKLHAPISQLNSIAAVVTMACLHMAMTISPAQVQ